LINELRRRLAKLLDEASVSSIGLSSFVDNQLRLLRCPRDLQQAVETGDLTTQEALILNGVKDDAVRRRVLQTHILEQGSDRSLMRKVRAVLAEPDPTAGKSTQGKSEPPADSGSRLMNHSLLYEQAIEELEAVDFGAADLFGEQARFIIECLRELSVEHVSQSEMGALLRYTEGFSTLLYKILKRQHGED
jgi:hypothetical protein